MKCIVSSCVLQNSFGAGDTLSPGQDMQSCHRSSIFPTFNPENHIMHPLWFSPAHLSEFEELCSRNQICILTDSNTIKHCLPHFFTLFPSLSRSVVFAVVPGERSKNIRQVEKLWRELNLNGMSRNHMLINLGGGIVSDIGGFAASTFKRGMPFMNVPTSLTAMVDAALGGKTGVNVDHIKNMAGTFSLPLSVLIHTGFLNTLPLKHLRSGFAEMLKTGLIADPGLWYQLVTGDWKSLCRNESLIRRTAEIKLNIAASDSSETGQRKLLNMGHTIGHALETFLIRKRKNGFTHGDAVAAGMVCEAALAMHHGLMSENDFKSVSGVLLRLFPPLDFAGHENEIIALMRFDKKNVNREINFTLPLCIGKAVYDQVFPDIEILRALGLYRNMTGRQG